MCSGTPLLDTAQTPGLPWGRQVFGKVAAMRHYDAKKPARRFRLDAEMPALRADSILRKQPHFWQIASEERCRIDKPVLAHILAAMEVLVPRSCGGRIGMIPADLRRPRHKAGEYVKASVMLCVLALTAGCPPHRLWVKPDAAPTELALYVTYGKSVDSLTVSQFRTSVTQFASEFNAESHRFKLSECSHDTSPALKIHISTTRLVSPELQSLGCCISTAGLVTPLLMIKAKLPFIITFWYVPTNSTSTMMALSQDIAADPLPFVRTFFL